MNPWLILTGLIAAVGVVFVCRAVRPGRATTHPVNPKALRLLEELDAHLDDYVTADPELAAGFDRLRAAIRDEQQNQKGD